MVPRPTLHGIARGSGAVAAVVGALGVLHMLGAFGPVYCWTSRSGTSDGVVTVTRGCGAGIDYLLGTGGANAGTFFAWAVVLAGVVGIGVAAVWRDRRKLVWVAGLLGTVVSIIGVFSIGWYFVLPTIALLTAATALTLDARRRDSQSA